MPKSKSKVKAKQNSVMLGFGKACVCTLNSSVFGSLRVNRIQNKIKAARITKSCGNAIAKAKSINVIVKKSAVMMFVRFEKINVFEAKSLINPTNSKKMISGERENLTFLIWVKSAMIRGVRIKIAPSLEKMSLTHLQAHL